MGDISTWSLIASQNGTLGSPPDYWPEGQAPSTVNDCAREMMRAIKKQFLDASWVNAGDAVTYISASKFSVSSSTSTAVGYYAVGRRIRLNDATTLYGTVTEASISATTTNITVALDSGSLGASLSAVAFSVITPSNTPLPPTSDIIYAADAQASDTYVISPLPAISSYSAGLLINFKANTVNTGACTLNVSGLGAKSIVRPGGANPEDGDIAAGQVVTVVYDGTNFVMQSVSQRAVYQFGQQIYAADASGSGTTYTASLSPAPLTLKTGMQVNISFQTTNTGAATLNLNSIGAKPIKKNYNQALVAGDIQGGQIITLIYDGTNFQMQGQIASNTATTLLNYNGSSQTVRSSTNVSSVTYTSAGKYIVNFTSSYADANYKAIASISNVTSGNNPFVIIDSGASGTTTPPTASNIHFQVLDSVSAVDTYWFELAVFA